MEGDLQFPLKVYIFVWFQSDPTAALEEYIISLLIAIARHSPKCANAVMNCQRLIQTVVSRFIANESVEIQPSKIKSVRLLKVGSLCTLISSCLIGFVPSTIRWKLYVHLIGDKINTLSLILFI